MSTSSSDSDRPGRSDQPDNSTADGTSPFATPPQYFRPPRLGIIHLLAWTATTAAWLKFCAASTDILGATGLAAGLEAVYHAIEVVYAAVIGASVVGIAVIFLGKARGEGGRLQPGHWFLLIQGSVTLLSRTLGFAMGVFTGTGSLSEFSFRSYTSVLGAIALLAAGAYLLVAMRMRESGPWTGPAVTIAIVHLVVGGVRLTPLAMFEPTGRASLVDAMVPAAMWSLIVAVAFSMALATDLGRGARRDWVHWLGVTTIVITSVMHVAFWAVFALTRDAS